MKVKVLSFCHAVVTTFQQSITTASGSLRVMCWNVLLIVPLEEVQGEKTHSSSGKRFIRFFPEPSRVRVLSCLFGFQMLLSLAPSQPCYSVQTCLHLLLVFLCMVDVLLKRPISNKSLFFFCWLIFSVFMNSGLSHGNSSKNVNIDWQD